MSVSTSAPLTNTAIRQPRPSFIGLIKGELFKIVRQRSNWIMLLGVLGVLLLFWTAMLFIPTTKDALTNAPYQYLFSRLTNSLAFFRVFVGFFLIVMTARMIGLDYQQGTIRIILGRGVSRVALLLAKLLTVVIVALAVLVIGLAVDGILALLMVSLNSGSLNAFSHLDNTFWSAIGTYILVVMISMGATILLATATTVLGRSLAFGLGLAMIFFPADNIGTAILGLISEVTHNDFWLKVSMYLLGPNINFMPKLIVPTLTVPGTNLQIVAGSAGASPLLPVDGTHMLVVTLVYSVIFLAVAIIMTWRKDVLE
ncbi:MAG TPA: ABC transporter permease subunit [Ktedonobacteraceae bacterium]|nr:ABC transporter permease subunit [Ktedonobacteraceae bacterium]